MKKNSELLAIRQEVKELCAVFPISDFVIKNGAHTL